MTTTALTLDQPLVDWLDGTGYTPGHFIVDPDSRSALRLGYLLDLVASYDGTDAGKGSDLIGCASTNSGFTGCSTLTDALDVLVGNTDGLDGDVAAINVKLDAIVANNTDVSIPVSVVSDFFNAGAGIWTPTRSGAGLYRLRRTAASAAGEAVAFQVRPRVRGAANKGFRVTGFVLVYRVTVADLVDVVVTGAYSARPANGAAPASTDLGVVTYDAAHDTAAERKAQGYHTMTGTFAIPVWINAGGGLVEILVTPDATGAGTAVLDILAVELLGTENLVDEA